MKIELNPVSISPDEIQMGMRMRFKPGELAADALSVTANTGGFTTLTAVARYYHWPAKEVTQAAKECNARNEIAVLKKFRPLLLLVPHTQDGSRAAGLMQDLLDACASCFVKTLHFTHYGMLLSREPLQEMEIIFKFLKKHKNESLPQTLVWDIDDRYLADLEVLHQRYFAAD